jgi:hypothetical protein
VVRTLRGIIGRVNDERTTPPEEPVSSCRFDELVPAVVIVWSADEPGRVGEVARSRSSPRILANACLVAEETEEPAASRSLSATRVARGASAAHCTKVAVVLRRVEEGVTLALAHLEGEAREDDGEGPHRAGVFGSDSLGGTKSKRLWSMCVSKTGEYSITSSTVNSLFSSD